MKGKSRKTQADYNRAHEARKIKAGGRRIPGGVMPADAAKALDELHAAGYGDSLSGCIFRAIVEAAEAQKARKEVSHHSTHQPPRRNAQT